MQGQEEQKGDVLEDARIHDRVLALRKERGARLAISVFVSGSASVAVRASGSVCVPVHFQPMRVLCQRACAHASAQVLVGVTMLGACMRACLNPQPQALGVGL